MWEEFTKVVATEFTGQGISEIVPGAIRLTLAAILGGPLGYERERAGKSAGIRTHMLVASGAAMFAFVPLQVGMTVDALAQVLQGIVAGIGFLGAGAIVKTAGDKENTGLTTAAGIWFTAAIGMAAGLGRESTAIVGTVLALIVLALLPRLELSIAARHPK